MAEHLSRRDDSRVEGRQVWLNKGQAETELNGHCETTLLPAQVTKDIPVHHRQAANFAHPMNYKEESEDIRRVEVTPSPDKDDMENNGSLWSVNGPHSAQKPVLSGTPDTLSGVGLGDAMMNQQPSYFSRPSSGKGAPWQSSFACPVQNVGRSPLSLRNSNMADTQFDFKNCQVQDILQEQNDQKHGVDAYSYETYLGSSRELPWVWNKAMCSGEDLAYPVTSRGFPAREVMKNEANMLSSHVTVPNNLLLQPDRGVSKAAPEENLAALIRASVPDDVPAERTSYLVPIGQHRGALDSKLENTTGSNISFSKKPPGPTPKKLEQTLQTWADASITSDIVRLQEVGICEEQIQRAVKNLASSITDNALQVGHAIQNKLEEFEEQLGPGYLQPFRPSYSVLRNMGITGSIQINGPPHENGYSSNYRGDMSISHNRSAEIPASENCAVFLLGLPASVAYIELLGSLRNIGQVYAAVINPPTGNIRTSAAKIVFFERYQAERLMSQILDDHNFKVMDQDIRDIRWNKIKSARYPHKTHSRVIRVTGRKELMDFDFFESFFKTRFTYDLESRRLIFCADPKLAIHEWRFGSLRCQAASAKTAIERELLGIFTVEWSKDPCA